MRENHFVKEWCKWPLPVRKITGKLNPFEKEGVALWAALAFLMPYGGVKFLTVLGLLEEAARTGMFHGVHTLVEATSGNTGVALASMARHYGNFEIQLVVSDDLPHGKRDPLVLAGAHLIPPQKGMSAITTARAMGGGGWKAADWKPDNGCLNLDQYANPAGARIHTCHTAIKILGQMEYPPTLFAAGVGTGGTLAGIRNYFAHWRENFTTVPVILAPGYEIPGVRDRKRLKEIKLPWEKDPDKTVEITTRPSYLAAVWLNQAFGFPMGPSSGLAYLGCLKALADYKKAGTLDTVRDKNGQVHALIFMADGNGSYGDRFMANLPAEYLNIETAPLPWAFPGSELW
jgi:cysteine synthase B